jgi:hypothetical protein
MNERDFNSTNSNIVYSNDYGKSPLDDPRKFRRRGIGIYEPTQLIAQIGRTKEGANQTASLEQPYFYLTIQQRVEICKLASDVFSIITGRMNRISALDFQITPIRKDEDRIADQLKSIYQIYNERKALTDITSLAVKGKCFVEIVKHIPDCLPDLSNFNSALYRWKKNIGFRRTDEQNEIKDWMMEPINGMTWDRYIKKFVFDLLVHGAVATYKQMENNRLENFDTLPGGTVYRFKNRYFSAVNGYVQLVPGEEAQIMFDQELSYVEYLPTSAMSHSIVPLEALINKITETLLFDKLMSDQADGTKPPEKLVIITNEYDPFGDFDNPQEMPVNPDEQKRIELKLNTPRKYAVATLTGNNVNVVDLTRENTMAIMLERQRIIRESVGMVFNASNVEMNLTGSDSTNGRESGKIQQELSQGRGIAPILMLIGRAMTRDIIHHRYGYGYQMEYAETKDAMEQAQLDSMELNNGLVTINELREREGKTLFEDDQFNKPSSARQSQPDGSPMNPLNMRQLQ